MSVINTFELTGKTALVTGCSSGIGLAMAVALAVLNIRDKGLNSFLGASLAFAPPSERSAYRRMLMLGFSELETLLAADQLL